MLAAKRFYYNKLIHNSENKTKSTWKIINKEKGSAKIKSDIQCLQFNNNTTTNHEEIATIFNNYFLSIADTINKKTRTIVMVCSKGSTFQIFQLKI